MAVPQVSSAVFGGGILNGAAAAVGAPAGTFLPGTKVTVGSHRVIIQKYLSEGGFAHVYVVHFTSSAGKREIGVLKRVAVPDKDALANMRTEVETMKKLKGHKNVVTYIDSHASQLKGGGYEVFLLMEYCAGGGLIDFMNTRLKNRLTEPEILKIFSDAAEGVACMHYLKPPLLHRDLKVENILISNTGTSPIYKICDFGSAAPPRPAATSAAEGKLIEDDVQRHTTFQYRSPEMIDVYRKRAIDEKSDIWALGVLLYKLCYYTTPFEEQGQAAILSASFKYPKHPLFSDQIKMLIARMLSENPAKRPNIYQVVTEVCRMRGKAVPLKDIYAAKTDSEARSEQKLPTREPEVNALATTIGISHAKPDVPRQHIPEITPMRRGRPVNATDRQSNANSSNKTQGDPFAALDSSSYNTRSKAVEELSNRFPALNDFSLIQESTPVFQFPDDRNSSKSARNDVKSHGSAPSTGDLTVVVSQPSSRTKDDDTPKTMRPSSNLENTASLSSRAVPPKSAEKPSPKMVSTGTMTSADSPIQSSSSHPRSNQRPIWRVPRQSNTAKYEKSLSRFDLVARDSSGNPEPAISPESTGGRSQKSSVLSKPSLEGLRPSNLDSSHSLQRSRSANASSDQMRPKLSERSLSRHLILPLRSGSSSKRNSLTALESPKLSKVNTEESEPIESSVDYLKALEREVSDDPVTHHRSSSLHAYKRTSMSQASTNSPKNSLSSKFGDTFRRFDSARSTAAKPRYESQVREPSPGIVQKNTFIGSGSSREAKPTTAQPSSGPSASSQMSSLSYGLNVEPDRRRNSAMEITADEDILETEDLSPEMRRELEKRRLENEERRVEAAAAEYRQRLASNGGVAPRSRATAIQDRVKNLLDESERQTPMKRTASGYGRYTTSPEALEHRSQSDTNHGDKSVLARTNQASPRSTALIRSDQSSSSEAQTRTFNPRTSSLTTKPVDASNLRNNQQDQSTSESLTNVTRTGAPVKPVGARPSAPPKPMALRTTSTGVKSKAGPTSTNVTEGITRASSETNEKTYAGPESPDMEASFRKRYPQLSIEMVETEIKSSSASRPMRVKDV